MEPTREPRELAGQDIPASNHEPETTGPAWTVKAIWLFVGLGIVIRLVRYVVNYPIWHDEAFLAANFWDRDYVDLLRPLDYGQVAPWLFLAIERTAVRWLGYSTSSLRLFPTVCSILCVPLFRHVSGRVLGGTAQLLAVAVLATSFYPIRHGAEIKPYASDLLAALILLTLALGAMKSPQASRWWWALAAVSPCLIAISYPAVFVAGGISLALAPQALRSERRAIRLGWVVYSVVMAASFMAVFLSNAVFQAADIGEGYRKGCWAESFPPLEHPWTLPLWFLDIHAGTMMAYPIGDRHGASILTLLCVIVGGVALYRKDRKRTLALLLAPLGLGLIAAFLGRYPYGGAPRIMQYAAPSICLLMGLGLSLLIVRLDDTQARRRALLGVVAALGLLGLGLLARDLAKPYRVADDVRTRDFARWFWTEKSRDGEVACLKTDLGLSFEARLWRVGMSAVYLFHQRTFSERHRQRGCPHFDPAHFSEDRPLRLVAFDHLPTNVSVFEQRLAVLGRSFELKRTDTYVIQPGKPTEDWLRDAYVVQEWVPRPAGKVLAHGSDAGTTRRRF